MTEGVRFEDHKGREIVLGSLSDVAASGWVALFNDPEVRRHLPLATGTWDEETAQAWAAGKDAQWAEFGFGPWSIRIDGAFAGWGGFQKEEADADLGLVLLPAHWGMGGVLFRQMVNWASTRNLPDVTILLPPSRTRLGGLRRLGFVPDGEVDYNGERFLRFRLRWQR